MTKLVCPICQSKFSFDQAAHETLMREMVGLAAKFGRNWELVYEYSDCFRVEMWGSVGLKKRVRILREVWGLFDRASFEYQGKKYRTDWARIIAGMTVVVNAEKFGFRNHNYLKKVMMTGSEKLSAEGLTAGEEEDREGKRREGETENHENTKRRKHEKTMTSSEYKKKHGIESLANGVGKKT